jgi:hypothetical protein
LFGLFINLGDYQTYWRQEAIVAAAGPVAEIRYRKRSSHRERVLSEPRLVVFPLCS